MDTGQDTTPAYRKMHVVGPRQAIALDDVKTQRKEAKALRDYNPTVSAMVDVQSDMKDILDKAATDAHTKPRKRKIGVTGRKVGASTSLALYNACLERLHALKSQFDSSYEPLLQLLTQNNAPAVAPAAAPAAVAAAAPAPPAAAPAPPAGPAPAAPLPAGAQVALMGTPLRPAAVPTPQQTPITPMQAVDITRSLAVLPKTYHERYTDLHRYLVKDPSLIKVASKGQLAIRGTVIPGSSFNDLVRALYVTPRSSKANTTGMSEFLEALSEVGVPKTLLSASAARTQYAGIRLANRDDQVSSSGYSSQKKKARDQSGNGRVTAHFVPTKTNQTGRGRTDCFPGQPIKCLRLY